MVVIVFTVIIQGIFVPAEDRGGFSTPQLTVNGGIFQAIGVISFGIIPDMISVYTCADIAI
jgi:solute carrier family 38 (sodium-coupled neutral amino acid transporter), member 11